MSDQNTCSNLEIKLEHSDHFEELLAIQRSLQVKIDPHFINDRDSIAQIGRKMMCNKHALEEELNEMLNALGGTHDPLEPFVTNSGIIGSGAWKWWKKSNVIAGRYTINALSERDLIELKMEIVDQFHFFMNNMLLIGMTGSELYSMYKSKNAENIRRQENNY
jgi:hypothetical protein